MTGGRLLRALAFAIAFGGIIDPLVGFERQATPTITMAVVPAAVEDGASPGGGRGAAMNSAERLQQQLGTRVNVVSHVVSADQRDAACPEGSGCVLIVEGVLPARVLARSGRLLGIVSARGPTTPPAHITRVDVPGRQHLDSAGELRVELAAVQSGGNTHLELFDDGVPVGRAPVPRVTAPGGATKVALQWAPLGPGVRHLELRAVSADPGDDAASAVDVGVFVDGRPDPVVIYDPRPSWSSTFVRRALEASPRFAVRTRTRIAPGVVVSAGESFALRPDDLETASVVIVGAPEQLTASEIDLLRRYVQERGGSLLLLPDRAALAASATLWPGPLRERVTQLPLQVGQLRASELLLMPSLPPGARAIAAAPDGTAVVAAAPRGAGRVILGGALDGWRYRAGDGGSFDRFWQSMVAEAAALAGPPLAVTVEDPLVSSGDDIVVQIERRSLSAQPVTAARATVACAGAAERPIRVWPDGVDRFVTRFAAERTGACRVLAVVEAAPADPQVATLDLRVIRGKRRPHTTASALNRLAALHQAPVVSSGEEDALARALLDQLGPAGRVGMLGRPMRSPWWLLPFAACLTGEWWLRRRGGLR